MESPRWSIDIDFINKDVFSKFVYLLKKQEVSWQLFSSLKEYFQLDILLSPWQWHLED